MEELKKLLQEIRLGSGMSPHNFALELFKIHGVLDAGEMTEKLIKDEKELNRCKRVVSRLEDVKFSVGLAIDELTREE